MAKIKALDEMMGCEGQKIPLLYDNRPIMRRVYFRKACGLFVIINKKAYFEDELRYGNVIDTEVD